MQFHETMSELEELGTAQNRKVYARHGVRANMFGVSYANLGKLKKRIKADHDLAIRLWDSKNHDACVLATMIADPQTMELDTLGRWVSDLDSYVLSDALARLAVQVPGVEGLMERWISSENEWRGRTGWLVLAGFVRIRSDLKDDFFSDKLRIIEAHIHSSENRTKDAMNSALMSIGIYRESLRNQAILVARSIGKVDVDHGETGCKTPNAEDYILKAVERLAGSNENIS